jgi:toxin-antitoxin system PIN domain toxin
MILPDVNVLIYAFRPDEPNHPVARPWLEQVIQRDAKFALSKMLLSALVRVTTNRRSYPMPAQLDQAFGFADDLMKQPHCMLIEPGEHHWDIFRRLCVETGTRGGDVTDAWYAALAIEWGCEWVTFDRDFLKFPGLNCTILSPRPT